MSLVRALGGGGGRAGGAGSGVNLSKCLSSVALANFTGTTVGGLNASGMWLDQNFSHQC